MPTTRGRGEFLVLESLMAIAGQRRVGGSPGDAQPRQHQPAAMHVRPQLQAVVAGAVVKDAMRAIAVGPGHGLKPLRKAVERAEGLS